MLFHGLGGTREDMAPIAPVPRTAGYASLDFDARGHGARAGSSARRAARGPDTRELFTWLTARAGRLRHADRRVRASRSAAARFLSCASRACRSRRSSRRSPGPTCTGARAAGPGRSPAHRKLLAALCPRAADPSGCASRTRSEHEHSPAVTAFTAQRSPLPGFRALTTPTFFIQGRRDYAFDIDQATCGIQGGSRARSGCTSAISATRRGSRPRARRTPRSTGAKP